MRHRVGSTLSLLLLLIAWAALVGGAPAAHAAESELEEGPPPASVDEIRGRVEQQFDPRPTPEPRVLVEGLLDDLPPFFSDATVNVRLRSRYRNTRLFDDGRQETWAGGGSVGFHSGWLKETAAVELGYFTSQRIKGEKSRDGAGYLEPGQHGFGVLGIANLKLRHERLLLTAYRQELDLPYLDGSDSRMVPNTFEALTVRRDGEQFDWIAGHVWRIKLRDSDEFVSIGEIDGGDEKRGLSLLAVKWNPDPQTHAGLFGYYGRDIGTVGYGEASRTGKLGPGLGGRLEGQFAWGRPSGDALLTGGDHFTTWQIGLRGSTSWRGVVGQLAATHTDDGGPVASQLGGNPSYLDRMQAGFARAGEDAVGLDLSWNFAELGAPGWSVHGSVTQGWGGRNDDGTRSDRFESDLTVDYRPEEKRWLGLWLRLRASVLYDDEQERTQNELRLEVQYDFDLF